MLARRKVKADHDLDMAGVHLLLCRDATVDAMPELTMEAAVENSRAVPVAKL